MKAGWRFLRLGLLVSAFMVLLDVALQVEGGGYRPVSAFLVGAAGFCVLALIVVDLLIVILIDSED